MSTHNKQFRRLKALHRDPAAWEAACDRCGMCCAFGEHHGGAWKPTDIACKLLDLTTCRCQDYANRVERVPHCVEMTPEYLVRHRSAFPATCSYFRVADGLSFEWWHHTVSGSYETVHEAGISARGKLRPEVMVRWEHERTNLQNVRS